jgi:hypothetical protein
MTEYRARMRFRAIGPPITPNPMKPIAVSAISVILSLPRAGGTHPRMPAITGCPPADCQSIPECKRPVARICSA